MLNLLVRLSVLSLFVFCAVGLSADSSHTGEIFEPEPAPAFEARTLDDDAVELKELKGKLVLLEFWRRECSDCILTMEKLIDLRKEVPEDQLVIIGINCDQNISIAKNYLRRKPADWPQIHARSQEADLISLYKVKDLPAFCLVDSEGDLIYRGERVKIDELMEILSPHLKDKSCENSE